MEKYQSASPSCSVISWKHKVLLSYGFVILVRLLVSLSPYSGHNTPPLYGDLEAQRHWMEITVSLPPLDWYRQTSDNDLQYWGIDYPPLSAYYSWICGKIIQLVDEDVIKLHVSRGIETESSKCLLRLSVVLSDAIFLLPACLQLCLRISKKKDDDSIWLFVTTALEPCLLLIDHGHFQYNGVSIALVLWSIIALLEDDLVRACIFYTCSIHFKQTSLYYSICFASYFFSKLKTQQKWKRKLFQCVMVTLFVFLIIWWPWLKDWKSFSQVLSRIFPVSRGLYEDKVANFWCTLSPFLKVHRLVGPGSLLLLCSVLTAVSCMPFVVMNWKKPTMTNLLISFTATPLCFYLFSYQVHEKQIILSVFIAQFLSFDFFWLSFYFSLVGLASMFPLFMRENLHPAYIGCCFLQVWLRTIKPRRANLRFKVPFFAIFFVLHILLLFANSPKRYPHMFILLCTSVCCVYFVSLLAFLIWISIAKGTSHDKSG
ncbi:hypothetical protein GAYE_SCF03G2237 [Galdieria yellowstonensis]|uniref:Alpha-1,3-glucosyltransferase n=1 Tax=Galdieria yellowstonensis TaxID=3028027 RepID=A0AAV9IAC0_9RHOD|nr:hypothetical protein GAYE_SCF03G2237 [Galdieria yellowstonensis]